MLPRPAQTPHAPAVRPPPEQLPAVADNPQKVYGGGPLGRDDLEAHESSSRLPSANVTCPCPGRYSCQVRAQGPRKLSTHVVPLLLTM